MEIGTIDIVYLILAVSLLCFWAWSMYHLLRSKDNTMRVKTLWFIAFLIFGPIGSFLYLFTLFGKNDAGPA